MTTSNTRNAYKNLLCCKHICLPRGHISISSSVGDIGRQDFFCHAERVSCLCGTSLCLGSAGSNHPTKKHKWELGQKLPSVDNFMGSLRNCTPHTCYCYRKLGNYVFREGMKGKIILYYITHIDPSSKKADQQERTVSFLHSLRGGA